MNKKNIKKLMIAMGMTLLTVTTVNIVNESKYILFGTLDMPIPNDIEIVYKWNEHNYTHNLSNGVDAWNKSKANINFSIVEEPSDNIYVSVTDYSFGNIGWHAKTYSYSIIDSSPNIQINDSYYPFKGNGDELIAHELGHILRLADVPNDEVLMRAAGYKGSANNEEQDIEEVKLVYKDKDNAKLDYYTEDTNELINDSEYIVVGKASNIDKVRVNNIDFQIVDFKVDKCIKGDIKENLSVKIVQTCNIVQESLLENNGEYLLFVDKYNGSIVDNVYVAKGLHHGVYRLENKKIQAASNLNNNLKKDIENYLIDEFIDLVINIKN